MPGAASGFCVYNDAAVGIRWLLANGAERVAYVDLDVHHGDGVERIFWNDSRVLTISVHETGRALFPGTGWPTDIGGPEAEGDAVNVSLPPGLPDAGWLRAIHATVPALVRAFKPDVLVTQHGCDTHVEDPLAHFAVSVDAQRSAADAMHRLAHDVCGGRWVALGGGGYEVVDVVPRTWTHLTAIAAHAPIKTSELGAAGLARPRRAGDRPARPAPDGRPHRRGRPALVALVGDGLRPRERGRPRDHGDAQRRLPPARPRRPLRLTTPATLGPPQQSSGRRGRFRDVATSRVGPGKAVGPRRERLVTLGHGDDGPDDPEPSTTRGRPRSAAAKVWWHSDIPHRPHLRGTNPLEVNGMQPTQPIDHSARARAGPRDRAAR